MTKLVNFTGLIFDFNGVLLWDDPIQRRSWRAFAAQLRDAPLTDLEIDLHVHGRSGRYTVEYLVGHPISQSEADALAEEKEIIYRRMCLDLGKSFQLSPGAVKLLDKLMRLRIPHTIATASGKNNVDFFIEHLQLDTWFEVQQIVYDNGNIPGKPAPDLYLHAAQNLNLEPEKCIVIEDSRAGIQAAYRARIGCILAMGPKATQDDLLQLQGVDDTIENLEEVCVEALFL